MIRRSPANDRNPVIGNWTKWGKNKDNITFIKEALHVTGKDFALGNDGEMAIVLVGSRDIPGTTLRQAQAILRLDRRPSYWSHAFVIADSYKKYKNLEDLPILEIPLFPRDGQFPKPVENGLSRSTLGLYKDPQLDANIGLFIISKKDKGGLKSLPKDDIDVLKERAQNPNFDRLRYDFWDSLCVWNNYMWSSGEASNPLRAGIPICASAYIEMIFEAIDLDLVPGASERHSAPEHLWCTALWWLQHSNQKQMSELTHALSGCFVIRDEGCSHL